MLLFLLGLFNAALLNAQGNAAENPPFSYVNSSKTERWDTEWDAYPTYSEYVAKMAFYAQTYPDLCSLQSIGTTVYGRDLWVLKISDNVTVKEAQPEFFYTASLHGDELTAFPLMIRLIDHLLRNYGSDPEVTNLVNTTEIFINPLANPDGAYGTLDRDSIRTPLRENANRVDLNRNFPDNFAGIHVDGEIYQPETQAFMNFAASRNFVLSANFHSGAEVVNYPYDNTRGVKHPDHQYYEQISRAYVKNCNRAAPSTYMTADYDAHVNKPSPGVTQGALWYPVTGGRQDYTNFYHNSKEVTIEISNEKTVPGDQLPQFWDYNRQAFLDYIKQANYGFQGKLSDSSGNPIVAKISIQSHDRLNSHVFSNADHGDYYRLIAAGTYQVTYTAPGYIAQTVKIKVTDDTATIRNIVFLPANAPPKALDQEVFEDENTLLTASGLGELYWYSSPTSKTPIFKGNTYTTPNLKTTTSYYVEDHIAKANVGSRQSNTNGDFTNGDDRYLIFHCTETVLLQEVTINAQQTGDLEVQLQDSYGNTLAARIISLTAPGIQTIHLDFLIPVSSNLRLVAKHLSSDLQLYRNNIGEISFPFTNGSITITGSSAMESTKFYYFFYDWKVAPLKSARLEVSVVVNPKPSSYYAFEHKNPDLKEFSLNATSTEFNSYNSALNLDLSLPILQTSEAIFMVSSDDFE